MPIHIVVQHGLLILLAIVLLFLIVATGNFSKLGPAAIWIAFDLFVSIVATIACGLPHYRAMIPVLAWAHFVTMFIALGGMWWWVHRDLHPLADTFFMGFLLYAAVRLMQVEALAIGVPLDYVELLNTATYALVAGVMIFRLLVPIPPDVAAARTPRWNSATLPSVVMARVAGRQ